MSWILHCTFKMGSLLRISVNVNVNVNVNENVNVRLVDRSLQGLSGINRLNGIGPNAC